MKSTKKSDGASPAKIGEAPRFIGAAELQESEKLFREFARLEELAASLRPETMKRRFDAGVEAYQKDPRDSTMLALIHVAELKDLFERNIKVRSIVRDVSRKFALDRLLPFLKKMLERGVELARQSAEKIMSEEDNRIRSLTGSPLDKSQSQVANLALKPVRELEKLLEMTQQAPLALGVPKLAVLREALLNYVQERN